MLSGQCEHTKGMIIVGYRDLLGHHLIYHEVNSPNVLVYKCFIGMNSLIVVNEGEGSR